MSSELHQGFRLGAFEVEPLRGAIVGPDGENHHLEPKVMDVFVCLAGHAGELVTRDALLEAVWGEKAVSDEPLTRAIGELRRALGDDRGNPTYIETVPKRGYRLIGPVQPTENSARTASVGVPTRLRSGGLLLAATLAILLAFNVGGLRDWLVGGPSISSIAVLPFDNLTADPNQEYFSAALTEILTTELSKIGALRVISRQSVMRFRDSEIPMPFIANELGVDAVVEGSALIVGKRVRITVQLIDAKTDEHLWADTYDEDLHDVLAALSQAARSMAHKINVAVTPEEAARLATTRTIDPDALRLYQLGEFHRSQWQPMDLERAQQYFKQALEIDSDYAEAHVGVARCNVIASFNGTLAPKEAIDTIRVSLETALALDDDLADAHQTYGAMRFYFDWKWDEAEMSLRKSLELNRNHSNAHYVYTWFLSAMGRFDEARATSERAITIDPLAFNAYLTSADSYYLAGEYDLAIERLDQLLELYPKSGIVPERLGWSYLQKGMFVEAIENLELGRVQSPRQTQILWMLGHAYATAGRTAEARDVLSQLHEMREASYLSPYGIALVHVGLGEHDDAFAWLERAYDDRIGWMVFLDVEPRWDPLRNDPRFEDLIGRMGFPASDRR